MQSDDVEEHLMRIAVDRADPRHCIALFAPETVKLIEHELEFPKPIFESCAALFLKPVRVVCVGKLVLTKHPLDSRKGGRWQNTVGLPSDANGRHHSATAYEVIEKPARVINRVVVKDRLQQCVHEIAECCWPERHVHGARLGLIDTARMRYLLQPIRIDAQTFREPLSVAFVQPLVSLVELRFAFENKIVTTVCIVTARVSGVTIVGVVCWRSLRQESETCPAQIMMLKQGFQFRLALGRVRAEPNSQNEQAIEPSSLLWCEIDPESHPAPNGFVEIKHPTEIVTDN